MPILSVNKRKAENTKRLLAAHGKLRDSAQTVVADLLVSIESAPPVVKASIARLQEALEEVDAAVNAIKNDHPAVRSLGRL